MLRSIVGRLVASAILLGFLFGVLVLVFMPFEVFKMASARAWPSREGVITHAYVSPMGPTFRTMWRPAIRGTYRDTGEEFWITRVRYGEFRWRSDRSGADADVARYPPGTVVRVYFSPSNRSDTVLEPFAPWTTVIVISTVGLAGLLLPGVLFLFRRR